MLIPTILGLGLIILGLVGPSIQVDIVLQSISSSVTCHNVRPGQCCLAIAEMNGPARVVQITNLLPMDIAAIWRVRRPSGLRVVGGCSGSVVASRSGPGTWEWRYDASPIVSSWRPACGASYITLPAEVPPKKEATVWLAAEGLLGLVWGGGNWFASPSASAYFQRSISLPQSNMRRGIISAEKGQVYATPPPGVVFPTLVSINGTNYTVEAEGSLIYRQDETGAILNLTSAFQ